MMLRGCDVMPALGKLALVVYIGLKQLRLFPVRLGACAGTTTISKSSSCPLLRRSPFDALDLNRILV
jgi:hypothetical protein